MSTGPGPTDSVWTIHTAMSVLIDGNTNLDNFRQVIPPGDYRVETIDGHVYSRFPVGPALLALPVVFLISRYPSGLWPADLYDYLRHNPPGFIVMSIEKLIASLIVALTAVLIYALARRYLDRKYSLLVTAVFAYGTSAWSTASMALWSHGPSILFLTLGLLVILEARNTPRLIQFAGLPLALAFLMRPTNIIPVLLWTVYVFVRYRKWFWRYIVWALPIIIFFFSYNLVIYHNWLSPYYRPEQLGSPPNLLVALTGTLFSPSRGLFIFSPVFLFSLYGIVVKRKTVGLELLDYVLLSILLLHWILISINWSWWGGWSFGPRLFADMIPYLIYLMIPAVAQATQLVGSRKFAYLFILSAMILMSWSIHFRGATSLEVYEWNVQPTDIDKDQQRLWDWRDIQFLRGIGLRQDLIQAGPRSPQNLSNGHQLMDGNCDYSQVVIPIDFPHIENADFLLL
jgi:hypothetical protein